MIHSYAVSCRGAYHEKDGTPCQDAFYYRPVSDRLSIGAVADGLGSELYTDIASDIASKESVGYCAMNISPDMDSDVVMNVIRDSFLLALQKVYARAEADGNDPNEYDTTLALAVFMDGRVIWGNSGDSGMIVLDTEGNYKPVTYKQQDEEGRVYPLSFGKDKWEFGSIANTAGILLATDGIYDSFFPYLLKGEKPELYMALLRYMMNDRLFNDGEDVAVSSRMSSFIKEIPADQIMDDKTVLVMLDLDMVIKWKPDSYYAQPDWEALKRKKDDEYRRKAYPHLYKEMRKKD